MAEESESPTMSVDPPLKEDEIKVEENNQGFNEEPIEEKTNCTGNEDDFMGFSPPASPEVTAIHQKTKELETEILMLNVKKEVDEAVKSEDMSVSDAMDPSDNSADRSVHSQHFQPQTSDVRRRFSRGSSPADSTSSRGSNSRSLSRGSIKSEVQQRYFLPFEKGWKREVILKERGADILYVHPSGSKLKSLKEISFNLSDGLTTDNFTFNQEPLNAGADVEIVSKETPVTNVRKSGRIITPSCNYKIVEKLEEESRKRASLEAAAVTPIKREKLVLKLSRSGVRKSTSSDTPSSEKVQRTKQSISSRNKSVVDGSKYSRLKEENSWQPTPSIKKEEPLRRICSIACPKAMGLIPTLQCSQCLCLYHKECVDFAPSSIGRQKSAYICKSCREKSEARKQGVPNEPTTLPTPSPITPQPTPPPPPTVPQTLVSVNRRRFIVVPNLTTPPAASTIPSSLLLLQQQQQQQQQLHLATPTVSSPVPAETAIILKTEPPPAKKIKAKEVTTSVSSNFMSNLCSGYTSLLRVFQYLTVQELLRAARVCRLWQVVSQHPSLWKSVRMKNSLVRDWDALTDALNARSTEHLDLRKMLTSHKKEEWVEKLYKVKSLRKIDFGKISTDELCSLFRNCPWLNVCNAVISSEQENKCAMAFDMFTDEHKLSELRIRNQNSSTISLQQLNLSSLSDTLRVISLLNFDNWNNVDLTCIQSLVQLTDLELGDCTTLPASIADSLKNLTKLERVRLEKGEEPCPTVEILSALGTLPSINQLELVNFDVRSGFDSVLAKLRSVRTLLLIPNYAFLSGTSVSLILRGAYQLKDTLTTLVWVFTTELLSITELYMAQKTEHIGGQPTHPIPVLSPVPVPSDTSSNSALWQEIDQVNANGAHISVLSLSKVKSMLEDALPNTKVHAIKLPAQSTTRQTVQDLLV